MQVHPSANIFPPMTQDEFSALKADIAAHGVLMPVWTWRGQLLDGRHRLQACEELAIPCPTREWDGDEDGIDAFVMSLNGKRRDLTASQRAMVALAFEARAAERAKERQEATRAKPGERIGGGTNATTFADTGKAREEAASLVGVSPRYVSDAKAVHKAMPELAEKVRLGEVTLPQAMRELHHAEKIVRPMPTDKYRVFYADPPWEYGNSGVIGPSDNYGRAVRHYPSMSIRDLCDLPIRDMADSDAVLFLWVTSPLLAECFAVIKAWGFDYKTSFVWDKVKHNFGHYNSVRHEFLLICTRGSCTPDSKTLTDSVQTIERSTTHSEKPEKFRAIIDEMYPRGKRIELFARSKHDGWDNWGNE